MISDKQTVILQLLLKLGDSYGLDLVRQSDGQLKRGTVYVLLDRLETSKLIRSKKVKPKSGQQGPARRVYEITGEGQRALEAKYSHAKSLWGLEGA